MKEYKIKINAELLRRQLNQRKELSIIDNYNISNVGMPDPKKINDDFFKKYLSENQLNENLVIGGNQNSDTVTAQSQTTIRWAGYYYVGNFITREISSAFQQYGKGLIIVDNDSWGGDPYGRIPIYNAIRLIYGSSGNYGKYTAIDPALQCFVDCCSVGKRGAQFGKMWDASYPYGSPVLTNKNFTTGTYRRYNNYTNYEGLFGYYEDILTAFGPNNPASVYYTTLDLSQNFELLNSCGLIHMGITYIYMDYLKNTGRDCLCNLFTFPEPDFWDELVQWVYNGGIISITTRYPSCFNNMEFNWYRGFSDPECPAAIHLNGYINNFLSLFGGMINIGNPSYLVDRAYTSHIRSLYYTPNYRITTIGSDDYFYRLRSEGNLQYYTKAPLPPNPTLSEFKYIGYLGKMNYTELGDNFLCTGLYNGQPYGTQGIDQFGNVNPNQSQRANLLYGNGANRVLNLSGNAIPMKYADIYDPITYIGPIPSYEI